MSSPKITEFQLRINECIKNDVIKPAHVPFDTLGKLLVEKIPDELLTSDILVMTDVGLLIATLQRLKQRNISFQKVTFLTYDDEQANFAKNISSDIRVVTFSLKNLQTMWDNLKDMKFDVLVGNPPFQPETKERIEGSGSGNKIWHKFIELAFSLANPNAHLLFVTPNNWRMGLFKERSLHKVAQSLIWENTLMWYINARNPINYFPQIGHSNSVDAWYVINTPKKTSTNFLEENCLAPNDKNANEICNKFFIKNFNLESFEFIPRINSRGLMAKGISFLKMSKQGDEIHRWKVANTSAQVARGQFHWSSAPLKNSALLKVIVSDSGSFYPWYDDGNTSNGEHTAAFIVNTPDDGAKLVNFLNSKLITYIANQFMMPGAIGFPLELFERIPKEVIEKPWQEVFGFTQEELELIESHAN